MGMGRQIDWHVVPKRSQVGAVIEIVAAQVILIGLPGVGMLDNGEPGRRFEDFSRMGHRARVEVLAGNDHLARHLRDNGSSTGHVGSTGLIG